LGLLELLERLAVGQRCVHDLRILFKAKGLYEALKCSSVVERIVPRSEDLQLRVVRLGSNRFARVTVHKNDSVSVVIAASLNPYPLSDEGIADLWSSLGKVSYFLEGCGAGSIPPVSLWVVTCWHFSRDSVAFAEVSGKGFEITVGEANAVLRAYLKRVGDRCYVRFEKIEEPKETLAKFLSRKVEKG
jgi:hypothetical protein